MNIYHAGRGGGKTLMLIKMSAEGKGMIVTHSRQSAVHIKETAARMGYDIPFPITFEDLLHKKEEHKLDFSEERYLVDELSLVLKHALHIDAATIDNQYLHCLYPVEEEEKEDGDVFD